MITASLFGTGSNMRPYSWIILYQIYHLYKFNSLKNCKTGRTVESWAIRRINRRIKQIC